MEDVEDNVEDAGDIAADTVYLKEGKAEESATRSYLTKIIILRILGLGLSLGIIPRIVLTMINVPFTGRRATTRQTVDSTRGTSQFA